MLEIDVPDSRDHRAHERQACPRRLGPHLPRPLQSAARSRAIDDVTGETLIQRVDDEEETVQETPRRVRRADAAAGRVLPALGRLWRPGGARVPQDQRHRQRRGDHRAGARCARLKEFEMEIAKGKVFIVTGGASGLGEGTARMLAAHGGKVVIADLQDERGSAVAARNRRQVRAVATSARKATRNGRSRRRRALGKLVGLVNCAGIAPGVAHRRPRRRAFARAVHEGRHGQPDRQLQHDSPRRRGDGRRTSPSRPASAAC